MYAFIWVPPQQQEDGAVSKKRRSPTPPLQQAPPSGGGAEQQGAAKRVKTEPAPAAAAAAPGPAPVPVTAAAAAPAGGGLPVTREELRNLLRARGRLPLSEIVAHFRSRVVTAAEKRDFTQLVKEVAHLEATPSADGKRYLVLK